MFSIGLLWLLAAKISISDDSSSLFDPQIKFSYCSASMDKMLLLSMCPACLKSPQRVRTFPVSHGSSLMALETPSLTIVHLMDRRSVNFIFIMSSSLALLVRKIMAKSES